VAAHGESIAGLGRRPKRSTPLPPYDPVNMGSRSRVKAQCLLTPLPSAPAARVPFNVPAWAGSSASAPSATAGRSAGDVGVSSRRGSCPIIVIPAAVLNEAIDRSIVAPAEGGLVCLAKDVIVNDVAVEPQKALCPDRLITASWVSGVARYRNHAVSPEDGHCSPPRTTISLSIG
jgi:hypothetical protein